VRQVRGEETEGLGRRGKARQYLMNILILILITVLRLIAWGLFDFGAWVGYSGWRTASALLASIKHGLPRCRNKCAVSLGT
jgi:hypothetical protein